MPRMALTDAEVELLREWWADEHRTDNEIAQRFGVSYWTLYKRRREYGLPRRARRSDEYLPTPEQIASECDKLRKRHLEYMRTETERQTQQRVSAERSAEVTMRAFSFDGQNYKGATPL